MGHAIECRDIQMRFREGDGWRSVLRGIDLQIRSGELTIIAGPSGCGKTTLLSILGGALQNTGGSVEVFGHRLSQMRSSQMADFRRKHVGFIFQHYHLVPALTALENAAMPLIIAGASAPGACEIARGVFERLNIGHIADRLPKKLSGGQQQRVAIARALVHRPRLVLCDEPTAALDSRAGETVMEILQETAVRDNRVVLVVTHDQRIFSFADRLIEIEDGLIIEDHKLDGKGRRKPTGRQAA
jgi:putative ABC transport system ATP-binding protein